MKLLTSLLISQITGKLICQSSSGNGTPNPVARPILKDSCCPDDSNGIPFSSVHQDCCCGELYDIDEQVCCKPNGCDGTQSLKIKGSACEPDQCQDVSTVTTIGQSLNCTLDNKPTSTCELKCEENYVLVDERNGENLSTTVATCNNNNQWEVYIPQNLCCVQECPPLPPGVKIDYMVVLDKSSSIGDANFEVVKNFMKLLVDLMPLAADGNAARMSMITFNSVVENIFSFEDSIAKNKDDLKAEVDNIVYNGRGTHIYKGLEDVLFNQMPENNAFNRGDVPDILLVITDGRSRGADLVQQRATELKDRGVEIYAIGVATSWDEDVRGMASEPKDDHLTMVQVFEDLEEVAKSYIRNLCPEYACP